MNRRFAFLLGVGAALFIPRVSFSQSEVRPNVVVILADDLGWRDLGCYGSAYHKTPNLNRLAAEGIRFTSAYAACPVCSPTRAALLTGKYPARLHLTDWLPGRQDRPDQMLARPVIRQQLPLAEETLAESFRQAGYATACFGKWHLGGEGFGPKQQGFDQAFGSGAGGGSVKSHFGQAGADTGEALHDRISAHADRFIREHAKRPFFLYVPHYLVHTPIEDRFANGGRAGGPTKPGEQSNAAYAGMMAELDRSVGRILQTLDELNLAKTTIVVFTSDNGGLSVAEGRNTPATINSPLREGKGYLYEGGLRVPLVVRYPTEVRAGATSDQAVSSIDLAPTLRSLCKLEDRQVDGVSWAPLLAGKPLAARPLFWHYPHYSNQGGKPGGAIRDGAYKLIEYYEDGRQELFNVEKDLAENQNLADLEPEIATRLAGKLAEWRKEVGAQEMTPNPGYVANPQDAKGVVSLAAKWARVVGRQLRYEPLPHKNTLGFWTRVEDRAEWEFTITQPGSFQVEVLQGCGAGQGGSEVSVRVDDQALTFVVEDTGHFQNFKPRVVGAVSIPAPGRHRLTIQPLKKAKAAVMDVRQVRLIPIKP